MTQKPQNFARYPGYIMFALVDDPATRNGWDVLDLITGDRIESHQEAIGVGEAYQNGSYTNGPVVMEGQRSFVVRKTQFLMGRKEKDIFAELHGEIAAAKKRVADADLFAKNAQVELAQFRAEVNSLTADRSRALEERARLTTVKDKLERDMSMLRKQLGEKVINDVLASNG